MNYQFYDASQSYPQTPVDNGFNQRRPSSSGPQPQSNAFLGHTFEPQAGGQGFGPHQYPIERSNGWAPSQVEPAGFPNDGASQFNAADLNVYTRSAHEDPWNSAGRTQARTVDTGFQFFAPASVSYNTKAHTVAGPGYSPGIKRTRPSLGTRPSFASIPDSGYVSQRAPIESIPGITQAEVKEIPFIPVADPQCVVEAPKRAQSVKTDPHPISSNSNKRRKSKAQLENCHICDKELKNPSEATKHELQHTKPYRCPYKCTRKEGFATVNDLERHKKSVHSAIPKVGKKSRYYCRACLNTTPGMRPKSWPRLDNFKAHIRRKHTDVPEDELIQVSEDKRPSYPESHYDESQYTASNPTNEMDYQHDLSSPVGNAMSRHASQSQQQDMNMLFPQSSAQQIAHVGGVGGMIDFQANIMRGQQIEFQIPQYNAGDPMATLYYAAQLSSPVESAISPTNTRQSAPEIYITDCAVAQYGETEMEIRPTKRLRTVSMPSPAVSHSNINVAISPTISSAVSSGFVEGEMHPCTWTGCTKVKRRECDLRKHMKRHTRPYGCTFAKCPKRFGSRNDWKRHENSQHFLAEMWRCEIKRPKGDTRCGHLSHDQEQFTKHLAASHDYKIGSEEIKTQARNMHLGREGHHHFWCGFCNKLIEQAEGIQPGAWDVRFKHIGDHFDKDNFIIDDWIDIQLNKKKKFIDHEEQNKKSGSKPSVEDDSDLGEDGIILPPAVYHIGQAARVRRVVNEDADADGVSDDEVM